MTLLALLACGPTTVESPATLEDMTQLALRDFLTDDAATRIADLQGWAADNVDDEYDGYHFDLLPENMTGGLEHDAALDWTRIYGAGVLARAAGSLADYVAIVPEADQSFADSTYDEWSRTILSGTADDFGAGGDLDTDNHVVKRGVFNITVPYDMYKDYRWFGGTLAALTWVPHQGYADDGVNGIVGGYTVELWFEDDAGVIWYNGSWSDLRTAVDDLFELDAFLDELVAGTLDYYCGTQEHATGDGETGPCA